MRIRNELKKCKWILNLVVMLMCLLSSLSTHARQTRFHTGRVNFSVHCHNRDIMLGYAVQSLFVLPGEILELGVVDADWKAEYALKTEAGQVNLKDDRLWQWETPQQTGVCSASIVQLSSQEAIRINLFVMIPFLKLENGLLNNYRIGNYPAADGDTLSPYASPPGFIEVTEENLEMALTPHFYMFQFVCRQEANFPKYIVLDERLLIKLETLLAKVNAQGYRCKTLQISSGYRTPYYNRRCGYAKYSSHIWGKAADICIDRNCDGKMDDLNRNGISDLGDVKILQDIVESLEQELRHQNKLGGIGIYDQTEDHGPFVHIDVRGEQVRWHKGKRVP